jgi:hypothetical protein
LLAGYGLLCRCQLLAQVLSLPGRPADALSGSEFAKQIAMLPLLQREEAAYEQILAGNVPSFLRHLCPVQVTNEVHERTNRATFFVTPDYLAVGSDADYFLMPLSPQTAQRLADTLGCCLPTRKMVDATYSAAPVKLFPSPIPPGPAMTTVAVFSNHNSTIHEQRAEQSTTYPLGELVAGHKKDVVISAKLATAPGKLAIYGWHKTNGEPTQPLYLGHTTAWVDYSQCSRLVLQKMIVNGQTKTVTEVLADPALAGLLSDEGPIPTSRYQTNAPSTRPGLAAASSNSIPDHAPGITLVLLASSTNAFHERLSSFSLEPEVSVQVNEPADERFTLGTKVSLVCYALPNGNTTAQTVGKAMQPGDDWHYDIQHIGAQTRFLRERIQDRVIVVAYLENALKSWPAWRKKYGDQRIPEIMAAVKSIYPGRAVELVLSSHSGGGSLVFGYLNAVERIPQDVVRLAFLDSTYSYDRELGHRDKLVTWLRGSDRHFLCVLAYDDAVALLDGKTFVTAAGGTWGTSHELQRDLAEVFRFAARTNAGFQTFTALDNRVQFILKENPDQRILHTVQVERNGFIHSLLSGTPRESQGYEYFGPRAYSKWIDSE